MAVAALALLVAACGGGAERAGAGPRSFPVQVAIVKRDTLSVEIDAVGTLQAVLSAQVASQIDGSVSRIEFEEGKRVPQGKALVQLDQRKLRAALQAARAAAEQARTQAANLQRQMERNKSLLAQGAISKQAFDDLQSSYRSASAQVDQAEANAALARAQLADATIRAPFTGRVGERTIDVGDYVRKGDPLFTVTDDDTLQVRFTVPEKYADRLQVGSAMQVKVPSMPNRWFDGDVYFVSPTIDPTNRTVTLKAEIPNSHGELRAGSAADVRLVLQRRSGALVVPEAAIMPRDTLSLVFRIHGGKAVLSPVRVGVRGAGVAEILSGVSAGDTVVTAGQQRLEDGAPVRVTGQGPGVPSDTAPAEMGSDTTDVQG